jgi:DNA-binding NarL/FixJ family response regulator
MEARGQGRTARRPVRILVADDHEIVRRGVRALLEVEDGFEIVGEAATGREAVAEARRLRPGVAIVDVSMPELNGLEATRRIRAALPDCEVLIFTVHDSEHVLREAFAAGAHGFVLKSDAARTLVTAVASLGQHKAFFPSPAAELLLAGYLERDGDGRGATPLGLTSRQREVLQLVAEGQTNKDVAQLLGIAVKTAEAHRTSIMTKLGLHSVGDLVRFAIREKLVEP